ncbi:MAG TPA: metal-dependent hydrolase [Candidatus Dormibacteraeota bacterium]|nr:metal-dependent hydrolase [Candidatus Dormibacteraeota bacterium]
MANAKQHALIGAGIGAVGWLLYCKLVDCPVEVGEVLLAVGVGMVGGLLPDLLDPAIHPNHRRFFHSYAATALLAHANRHVSQNAQMPAETRAAIHLISLGFFSHLAADAHTPKGLPWV